MLEIGSVLDGKYKILSEIGHGGMSVVYMALNEKANKTWAVKEIRKDGKMDFNTVRQGLVAEIETLKKLKHPNLPSVIDVIEDADSFIIVMDYIEGNSLDKALEETGAQPEEYVIEWAKQLCDVLGYLHSCDPPIIYRDMKPANIMLKPDDTITLIDFGTAKTYEINLGETTGIGTIGYAAPEQYIGSGLGRTDARTDIYCLGITLYHLLTGVDPCKNLISDRSIRAVNPALSPGLDAIIQKCTEHQPDDRYQSCEELLYALEHYTEMSGQYRKEQKKRLTSFIVTVVLAVVFACVGVFGYVSAENKRSEDYLSKLAELNNSNYSETQKLELIKEVVSLNPSKIDAYDSLTDLLFETVEDGCALSKEESNFIASFGAGWETADVNTRLFPLTELKKSDPEGYANFCNEIGILYWYDYVVESERQTKALEWFKEAVDYIGIAQTYCNIGECQVAINKYRGQKRTEKMYSEYKNLLGNIDSLYTESQNLKDNDLKVLAWREIADIIQNNAADLLQVSDKDKLESILNSVIQSADKYWNTSKDKESLEEIKNSADVALSKIESVRQGGADSDV